MNAVKVDITHTLQMIDAPLLVFTRLEPQVYRIDSVNRKAREMLMLPQNDYAIIQRLDKLLSERLLQAITNYTEQNESEVQFSAAGFRIFLQQFDESRYILQLISEDSQQTVMQDVKMEMLDKLSLFFVALDSEGTVVFSNRYFRQITGMSENSFEGVDYFERFIPSSNRDTLFRHFLESFKRRNFAAYYENVILCRGKERKVKWYSEVRYNAPTNSYFMVSYGRDITDYNDMQDKQIERVNRFVYNVSHDLRAPIRAILGFVNLLFSYDVSLDDKTKHYLERIAHNTQKLKELLDAVDDYSSLGDAYLKFREFSLNELLEEVLRKFETTITANQVEIKTGPDRKIYSDRKLLRIILENLIGNALKFHDPQKKSIVHIFFKPDNTNGAIYVEDNGIGFDPKKVSQIFGMFERLHGEETYPGTGVGLALVQRCAERIGANIEAEAKPGLGATFRVVL